MPRWTLPAVVVGDVAVIAVLYAVLGWPALIVGLPLVICSIVVIVVVGLSGSRSPAPPTARAFVNASGTPRGPAGAAGVAGHGDDDWYFRTNQAGDPHSSGHDGWTSHRGADTGWYDPGCSDYGSPSSSSSGPSSSDSGCSSSDSGSSDSGSSSSSSD